MEKDNYILCIGEDDDDCTFMTHAIANLDPSLKLRYQFTGFNGVSYLTKISSVHSILPQLIVIDLDMAGMSGKETLTEIRKIAALKTIPVLFLSNNPEDWDKRFLEKNQVTILRKPRNMNEYNQIAETIVYSLL